MPSLNNMTAHQAQEWLKNYLKQPLYPIFTIDSETAYGPEIRKYNSVIDIPKSDYTVRDAETLKPQENCQKQIPEKCGG